MGKRLHIGDRITLDGQPFRVIGLRRGEVAAKAQVLREKAKPSAAKWTILDGRYLVLAPALYTGLKI